MTNIAGRTILLTGASRGIGAFIARALAKEKATVVGVARSQQGLDKLSTEVQALGGRWLGIKYDLSNIKDLPNFVDQIQQVAGPVDILINNAGIEIYKNFQDYTTSELQSVLTINLLSGMELTRLLLPIMLRQKRGHIINIASLSGKKGNAYNSVYCGSKAGLLMWSDALRQELVGTGVNVSVICPGYVCESGMFADTGIPAPSLAGTSKPKDVAIAVIQAIKQNQAEVIVNQDWLTTVFTKFLLVIWQIFPRLGDKFYQWIGVTKLNQKRAANQINITSKTSENKTIFSSQAD
jgi:short-subunit dehydrogenase